MDRRLRWLAPLLLLPLTGCGDDGVTPGEGAAPDGDVVTVEHRYGTTEVPVRPARVVTLDQQWTDSLLALGVQPVGYAVDSFADADQMPWQDVSADAEPLDVENGPPLEKIAALDPDLILGTFRITDQGLYDKLSGIAPTIASLADEEVTPWRDLAEVAGEVLDEDARADEVVAEVDAAVDATAAELPGLAGRTFALAQYVVGDSMYVVADPEDGSSDFFQRLGMELYPPLLEEAEKTGSVRVQVSTERADLLRSDLLAFLVNGGDESDLADIPGFDALPGTVAVLDYATIVGLNTPSPLSIPYSLEQLRPHLEAAAAVG